MEKTPVNIAREILAVQPHIRRGGGLVRRSSPAGMGRSKQREQSACKDGWCEKRVVERQTTVEEVSVAVL